jgi:hypothetical protein
MTKVAPSALEPLFPNNEVVEPHFDRQKADYVVEDESDLAYAEENHDEDDRIYLHPDARVQLKTREYEITCDFISNGGTVEQTTKAEYGWATWQFDFTGGDQVIVGINALGPLSDGTWGDDRTTNNDNEEEWESWILGGFMSHGEGNTFYECMVDGFTYGNFMGRAPRQRVLNSRTVNAAFDHLGYGIAFSTSDDSWENRSIAIGNYTDNCRHHIEHGGRTACTEIAYSRIGPNAPFGHRLDVHREGAKKTVWHHLTVEGPPRNPVPRNLPDGDRPADEDFNFRGTPLDRHEVYAVAFDYAGAEPPETSNDTTDSDPRVTIVQTNQGLEDRYTWAENERGDINESEYRDSDLPDTKPNGEPTYIPDNTDGIKGFDKVYWVNRDNAFGGAGPEHVGAPQNPTDVWARIQFIRNDKDADNTYWLAANGELASGEVSRESPENGEVSGGTSSTDTFYAKGGIAGVEVGEGLDLKVGSQAVDPNDLPDFGSDEPEPSPEPEPEPTPEPTDPERSAEEEQEIRLQFRDDLIAFLENDDFFN